jgi:glycine/D-amino acid oxidase-like deaminating enzyme
LLLINLYLLLILKENRSYKICEDSVRRVRDFMHKTLADDGFEADDNGEYHPCDTETCLYTQTESSNFILDKLTDRITIGSGFSGHGFKMGPVIGPILRDLALHGKTSYNISLNKLH